MKKVQYILLLMVAFTPVMLWLADPQHRAQAQSGFSGTSSESAYNAAAVTGPTSFFRNIGQASHWLHYCHSGAGAHTVQLEGSDDNVIWYGISLPATSTSGSPCGVIETGGYFNYVRANVLAISGGSISAVYSSSTSAIGGGGIVQSNKTSQLVVQKPSRELTFISTSAPGSPLASCCIVVTGIWINNRNAGTVYAGVGSSNSSFGSSPELVASVPANSSAPLIVSPNGVDFSAGPSYVICSATFPAFAAPASPCDLYVQYKITQTVLGKGNSAGAQTNTQQAYQ